MSAVTYNGVNLSYILTQKVSQGPEFDPSDTDQLYTRTRVEVQSIINPSCLPSLAGETPAATVARIRHLLSAPRRPLTFSAGGVVMLNVPNGLDDANGPIPDRDALTVTALNPTTFVVRFAVEAKLVDCGSGRYYLSNRWELTETFDKDWFAVRKTTGLLIVSSLGPKSPDDLRGLVTPNVSPGFRREQAEYKLTPDGLRYHYTFTDRQLAKSPPFPATSMTGRQVESVTLAGGKRTIQIDLTLSGPPTVPARDLMNAAIRVAMTRAWASNPQLTPSTNKLLVEGSISEPLSDSTNAVSLALKFTGKPSTYRLNGNQPPSSTSSSLGRSAWGVLASPVALPTEQGRATTGLSAYASWLGQPLAGSDPTIGIAPPTRGLTDGLRMVAAALNDPCGQEVALSTPGPGENDLVSTTSDGAMVSVSTTSAIPDDTQALYSDDGLPGVYDSWLMTAHYHLDTGQDVLPPALPTGAGKLIQIHGPVRSLRVEWDASRVGSQPAIPPETHPDPNWVLITSDISPEHSEPAGDGVSMKYTITGIYFYKALDPSLVTYSFPVAPYVNSLVVGSSMAFNTAGVPAELRGSPAVNP